jgi:hypothetical protein
MKSNVEIIELLQSILETEYSNRAKFIKKFQNEVWNDESIQDEVINETLSELAYDLDFYEPDEKWRKEDPCYYGDDKLEDVLKNAIRKLIEQEMNNC